MDPHHHGPHVMEVSKGKRYFLFATACTHVLLASGEAYGWTALRPVLQDSGLFDAFDPDQQSTLMNAVATMGIAGNALCKLPLGMILDKCGPRFTSLVGCLLLIAGSIILALCDKNDTVLPVLGYFLLGIAGPFIQMPCFQFSELFGTRKASAMAYLITCFELSTGVFWVFGELHREWNIQRRELFLGYSGGFLLATLGPQVEYFFQDPQVSSRLKNLFNIILPLGFVPMMFCTASGVASTVAGLLQLTQTQLVKYVEDPATPLDWQKLDLMLF
ncbi:hypothetical protein GUITHDRAFT_121897 [Guillardia theta CCMP2712]|uniref:Major facilitator superfamily (MFS) profile domain-containing protein n=1 Tax=Guillardia theta (strain CCMP2712) TaxID=905079 RepID=L1I7T7_GUITC|nr:hypothetical protein GUITHDRAFT_121897 [Guillardia theta CCMP2712]EKX31925.1 hypothetical protein GUITHDRAFT_121897 [Guillardia theta CCMP2712]|eukprot:XP_005818905.1 hypothetical protein GUITHDRAFT_121897 [Guillardia theta CCMP2712]